MFSGSPLPVTPRPTTGPACTAADVQVTPDGGNGGGGHLYRTYDFRNAGTGPCLLRGFPRVVASEPGKPPFVATDGGFFVGHDDVAATLSPGESAALSLETDTNCQARYAVPNTFPTNLYHTVTVSIPGGGNVVLAGDFDVECGLFTGQFSVAQPPQQYSQSPVAGVTVQVEVPKAVEAGAVLRYVVALTNPTSHDMVLSPCPSYQQGLGAAGKAIRALNCETVRSIAAGQTVRFAMQLDVPADTPAGPSQVYWNIAAVSDVMISASAPIEVERAAGS
jgi:hypothetical protein